ncbi:MAG: ribonuclease PH [Thermodesulfobacteriota bacterium]
MSSPRKRTPFAARSKARRSDGRAALETRPMRIEPGFLAHAEGSALVTAGSTQVLCAVSVEDRVPDFLVGKGRGWLTAEYSMLPRATHTRSQRESVRGKVSGRTHEIQRLIGRSLRAVVDLDRLGERTLFVDCDVLQADGGTRTTAINGAYVAVAHALARLVNEGALAELPLREPVAAISVGIVDGELLVDLAYTEDSRAEVDANFVMTGSGGLVEVQGTAEGRTFERRDLGRMLDAAWDAIQRINRLQAEAIASFAGAARVARARRGGGGRAPRRAAARG